MALTSTVMPFFLLSGNLFAFYYQPHCLPILLRALLCCLQSTVIVRLAYTSSYSLAVCCPNAMNVRTGALTCKCNFEVFGTTNRKSKRFTIESVKYVVIKNVSQHSQQIVRWFTDMVLLILQQFNKNEISNANLVVFKIR